MSKDRELERKESEAQRLDRNLIELLNELRVTGTGIQVLLAFLLIVPFNTGFRRTNTFEHAVYFVALLSIAASAVLLIAPSVHHRLLFRHHERPFIIAFANRLAIAGMALLAVGLVAILVLLSDVVFGPLAATIVGGCAAVMVIVLWFAVPIVKDRDGVGLRASRRGSTNSIMKRKMEAGHDPRGVTSGSTRRSAENH